MILRIRRNKIIKAIKNAIIMKKKVILLGNILNLQITSINLSKFYANDK